MQLIDLIPVISGNNLVSKYHEFRTNAKLVLILFLGDMYLLEKIKPFITEQNREIARKQHDEISRGGSDLVKLGIIKDGNRIKDIQELSYKELTQFVEKNADGQPKQEKVENGLLMEVTYPLQENKDAIVLYDNTYYYVSLNHETKMIEKIEQVYFIANNGREQNKLALLFTNMEMNSGRRSNNQEYQFIKTTTTSASNKDGIKLERKGIRYKRENDYYQDCKAESLIVRSLRKYVRLCHVGAALVNNLGPMSEDARLKIDEARLDFGKAQATDTADKLLLYCLKNIPLSSVPDFKVKLATSTPILKREFNYLPKYRIKNSNINSGIYSEYSEAEPVIGLNCLCNVDSHKQWNTYRK